MEIPSPGTRDHLGAPKQPDAQALEVSKTAIPTEMVTSKADSSLEQQEKEASKKHPLVDSLPEKQDKQALTSPEDHALPAGNQASEMDNVESLPERQALDAAEFSMENQESVLMLRKPMPLLGKSEIVAANGCRQSPTEIDRAEIDTAAPFESVKEAVTFFGDRKDWKPQLQILEHERKNAPGFGVQKANEELVHYREVLNQEEASVAEILLELEKTKEQIQMTKGRVPVVSVNVEAFPPSNLPEQVLNVGAPKELFVNMLGELEVVRKEIEGIHEERSMLESLKQSSIKEQEAAFSGHEAASIRIKELMTEKASSQVALVAAKEALAETESEINALKSISSVGLDGKSTSTGGLVHVSNMKLATLKSLELNLSQANTLIDKLKGELVIVRDVKAKGSTSVSNTEDELTNVKLRLEQAKAAEGDHVSAIGRILEELDVAKTNLSKVAQDGASLASTVSGLQAEVAKRQVELESAHETEQIACATLASLQDELLSIRALVLSARAGEAKAREAKRTYPTEIKQLASEADEAKAASKLAKEEARKSTLELEQAKAAMTTAVSRFQAAQKEAEAARACEAMAIAEFRALSESKSDLDVSKEGSEEGKVGVSISLEEYRALNDAWREAEGASNEKVAAALAQVEVAKASQNNAQALLDAAMNELEALQKSLGEAQKKADDAQAAKLSVESDLRKWRADHEQRRRTGSNPSSVSTSAAQSPRLNAKISGQGKVVSHSFQGKPTQGLDSLVEVLSLKLPAAEKAIQNLPEADVLSTKPKKAKKLSLFSRFLSILLRKKSRSGKLVSNA